MIFSIHQYINNKDSLADNNNFLETFTIKPNFDYFQTHDFRKLTQKKQAQNIDKFAIRQVTLNVLLTV